MCSVHGWNSANCVFPLGQTRNHIRIRGVIYCVWWNGETPLWNSERQQGGDAPRLVDRSTTTMEYAFGGMERDTPQWNPERQRVGGCMLFGGMWETPLRNSESKVCEGMMYRVWWNGETPLRNTESLRGSDTRGLVEWGNATVEYWKTARGWCIAFGGMKTHHYGILKVKSARGDVPRLVEWEKRH